MVKSLFDELVQLADESFCPEISHAEALFGRAADPDVPYSVKALRRLGRTRPAVAVAASEGIGPTGMRTTFGAGSAVRLEVFHACERVDGRRPVSASIRTGWATASGAARTDATSTDAARTDPTSTDAARTDPTSTDSARTDAARSPLTEHAVSYLVRNDALVVPVPQRGGETTEWDEQLLRTTHWVSDMRRRHDRIFLDDGTVPVLRIDDPLRRWAAVAFDLGRQRVTIAGAADFLDRRFVTTPGA